MHVIFLHGNYMFMTRKLLKLHKYDWKFTGNCKFLIIFK